jgi:putative transposase
MKEIDKIYLDAPFYGRRSMTSTLKRMGHNVNPKRISRLMKNMGLEAQYPKPKREAWQLKHGKFPYLLKNVKFTSHNHVWGTDITYIPLNNGFLYLVAFLDLFSRFVLSWQLSNNLESSFCVDALEKAFEYGTPQILNSDQGIQYTSSEYIKILKSKDIQISMSGKGRCWDNIFVERFWRSFKYEEVYLKQYVSSEETYEGINSYINFYNHKRPHSALNNRTPAEVYR